MCVEWGVGLKKDLKKIPHAACISTTAWPADAKWRRHTADTWTSTGESELTQWKVLLPQLSQLRAGKFAKYWKFRWMLYMELIMRGRKLSACGNFDAFGPTVTYWPKNPDVSPKFKCDSLRRGRVWKGHGFMRMQLSHPKETNPCHRAIMYVVTFLYVHLYFIYYDHTSPLPLA